MTIKRCIADEKQYVRDFLLGGVSWHKSLPVSELSDAVVAKTLEKYEGVLERLTAWK